MNLYLAGDILYNNMKYKGGQQDTINVYLAGTESRSFVHDIQERDYYILETFFSINAKNKGIIRVWNKSKFLLDSGAFTFMNSSHKAKVDFFEYAERYADFINEMGITQFFELDIDSIVGYEKVKEIRKLIERKTNKQVIPVWHVSRGKEDFVQTCKEYPYVAIGGIVTKEISPQQYKYFPSFIDIAHKYNAKIHGLGFTNLSYLPICHFDSVDSTSWTTGNRFGFIYKFNGKTMVKVDVPKGKRLNPMKGACNNFVEWLKFQKYAEKNL